MSESFKEFPKFIYHKTLAPRIVKDQDELDLFGDEWKNSPADHTQSEPKVVELHEMTEENLKALALEKGISKKKIKELSKEKVIEFLKGES